MLGHPCDHGEDQWRVAAWLRFLVSAGSGESSQRGGEQARGPARAPRVGASSGRDVTRRQDVWRGAGMRTCRLGGCCREVGHGEDRQGRASRDPAGQDRAELTVAMGRGVSHRNSFPDFMPRGLQTLTQARADCSGRKIPEPDLGGRRGHPAPCLAAPETQPRPASLPSASLSPRSQQPPRASVSSRASPCKSEPSAHLPLPAMSRPGQ